MDQQPDSSFPPVYHDADETGPGLPGEERVRLFALCDEDDDEQIEIALYGVALPGGATATITPKGRPHGCWSSPDRAAHMLGLDLVWLEPQRVNR